MEPYTTDYYTILDLATDVGYELAMSGAETFRVEDSVRRIIASFDVEAEVFAIPNGLWVSILTRTGKPLTRMRRIGYHGNDLDMVEKLNGLSRAICARHPEPKEAVQWLRQTLEGKQRYTLPVKLLACFLGASGFGVLFGCTLPDAAVAGLCGVVIGLVNEGTDRLRVNQFFATIASAFAMALAAYTLTNLGLTRHPDAVTIGALMTLVPGLLFTNAMRDIIYGDTNSGVNRCVQVVLIAAAIAMGTAAGRGLITALWREPTGVDAVDNPLWLTCLGTFWGCVGFAIQFNIHGPGGLLCALGGVLAWAVYAVLTSLGLSELTGYFWGAFVSAVYSEIMARVRRYPAISYLVVSIFPLIPGAGVYYTMLHAVRGEMESFASRGMFTAAIAGTMAVGILLVSTSVRSIHTIRGAKHP